MRSTTAAPQKPPSQRGEEKDDANEIPGRIQISSEVPSESMKCHDVQPPAPKLVSTHVQLYNQSGLEWNGDDLMKH